MHYLRMAAGVLGLAGIVFVLVAGSAAAQTNQAADALPEFAACDPSGDFSPFVSVDATASTSSSTAQTVSFDDDTVLLGIALMNNDIDDLGVENLSDVSRETAQSAAVTQETATDRDSVLSAVALGINVSSTPEERLACASDVSVAASVTGDMDRTVSLTDDDVLLAIALSNNLGGGVTFDDVATKSESRSSSASVSHDVSIDREEALLLLAFG